MKGVLEAWIIMLAGIAVFWSLCCLTVIASSLMNIERSWEIYLKEATKTDGAQDA